VGGKPKHKETEPFSSRTDNPYRRRLGLNKNKKEKKEKTKTPHPPQIIFGRISSLEHPAGKKTWGRCWGSEKKTETRNGKRGLPELDACWGASLPSVRSESLNLVGGLKQAKKCEG